jgi:hydrogenase expression/formation protein HypC
MCLGIPGKITQMRDDLGLAVGTVDFGGVRREVCLAYVAEMSELDELEWLADVADAAERVP